jgi:hypothetical protein
MLRQKQEEKEEMLHEILRQRKEDKEKVLQ